MSKPVTADNPLVGNEDSVTTLIVDDDLQFDDQDALYKDADDPSFIWTDYKVSNRYEKDRKTYMMGISSPDGFQGDSVAFVQLASPTLLWICTWTACRFGAKPKIPDPTSNDPNWVLLDDCPEAFMVTVTGDGETALWRMNGMYVYGHRNPADFTANDMNFPRPPWLDDSFDRSVPLDLLEQGISNTSQQNSLGLMQSLNAPGVP